MKDPGFFFKNVISKWPHVRESKTVLDSGFHAVDSGFPGTGFQSLAVELGFWIAVVIIKMGVL